MPPTTPYAGKFASYSNANRLYQSGHAPSVSKEAASRAALNPYEPPQPHAAYHVGSASARERHHSSDCPGSDNPYSSPPPHSPRQHGASCPARAHRHSSGSSGGEPPCRSGSVAARGRIYGPATTASYGEMCYHDNSLVSASLEALIQHLVPTVDYYPDVRSGRGGEAPLASAALH